MDIKESLPTISDIRSALEKWAPPVLAASYDNVGLHIGDASRSVHSCLIALDLTPAVVSEAVKHSVSLIITHHPLLFHPLKSITTDSFTGSLVLRLAEEGIALYSAHTNLDFAQGGVSISLSALLGIENPQFLTPSEDHSSGYGAIGSLPHPVPLEAFLATVAEKLHTSTLRFTGDLERPVQKVAVCGGAGSSLISQALAQGSDVYVTSDITYHRFFEVMRPDGSIAMSLVDAGHYETEHHTESLLVAELGRQFPEVRWMKTMQRTSPIDTYLKERKPPNN